MATVMLGLTLVSPIAKPSRIEIERSYGRPSSVSIVIKDTTVKFRSWGDIDFSKIPNKVVKIESSTVVEMLQSPDPVKDIRNKPMRIGDKALFKEWILNQLKDPRILNSIGVKDIEQATPKQLVELAVAITDKNLSYSLDLEKLKKSADEPLDKVLMRSLPAECSNYAVSTEAIFNILKEISQDKLQNIYVGTIAVASEKNMSHVFNRVTLVLNSSPVSSLVEITFIDSTAVDVAWGKNFITKEDFLDIIVDWKKRDVVSEETYQLLRYDSLTNFSFNNHFP